MTVKRTRKGTKSAANEAAAKSKKPSSKGSVNKSSAKKAASRGKAAASPSTLEARRVQAEVIDTDEATRRFQPFAPKDESDEHEENESFEPDGTLTSEDAFVLDPESIEAEAVEDESLDELADTPDSAGAAARLPVPVPESSDSRALTSVADPVATYLAEIRKYKLLTKEEERQLAIHYRETGDPKAAEALVTANLRFVVKIAAEYSRFGAKLIDLIQEGNVGLMHAVREFNPYKGVRLITYAVWWIRGYIQEYLMRQYSMVRIGTTQTQRKLFYRLQKEKERLDRMGQDPDIPLLSSSLGVPEEDIKTMTLRLSGRDISLNQPLDSESTTSLLDMEASNEVSVDERLGDAEQLEVLRENIETIRPNLSEKELFILDRRVLSDEPMTLQEIGEHYGVTREAVRQLEARLINKIRQAFTASIDSGHGAGFVDEDESDT